MTSESENVCSVKKEQCEGYYRIHTIWSNDSFKVNIASRDASWTGQMSPENIKAFSAQHDMDESGYMKHCKEALTSNNGKPGMVYAVENGSFVWKKVIDEDTGIKIKMGSVKVVPTSFVDTIQNFVNVALAAKSGLENEVKDLKMKNEEISVNQIKLSQKVDEVITLKNDMETSLYSRFLQVLNSKKRRIVELEGKLANGSQVSRSEPSTSGVKRRTRITAKEKRAYEMDTDNDPDSDEEREMVKESRLRSSDRLKAKGNSRVRNSKKPEAKKKPEETVQMEFDSDSTISDVSLMACGVQVTNGTDNVCDSSKDVSVSEAMPPASQGDLLRFFFGGADSPQSIPKASYESPPRRTESENLKPKKSREILEEFF